jgi:hypothetical protein
MPTKRRPYANNQKGVVRNLQDRNRTDCFLTLMLRLTVKQSPIPARHRSSHKLTPRRANLTAVTHTVSVTNVHIDISMYILYSATFS